MNLKTEKRLLDNNNKYRKTKKGVLTNIYCKHIYRSKIKDIPLPNYDNKYLHNKFLNDEKFIRLYEEWVKSGYKKSYKPSIDRINNKKPYAKNNIQIMTWAENRFKQNMERRNRNGIVIQISNGKIIKKYKSQREAVRELGVCQSMLSMALTGRCKTAYGYEWKYENPELLKGEK